MFYQIDHSSTSSGKRVNTTKRRVVWRWGIANKDALATGVTGVQCRGREHEIVLDWSVASRKRVILLDGKEVHFSIRPRTERKFQYSWVASGPTGLGHHVFTVIAQATAPLLQKTEVKQFDLLIDGQSCSKFLHLNEVGMCKLPLQEDMPYGTVTPGQHNHFAQQVTHTEPKRKLNQISSVIKNGMTRAVPRRRKSVAFSCDITNVDLLSGARPVQTNHYSTTNENKFNAVVDPNPTELSPYGNNWSTTVDAYDSRDMYGNKENPPLFQIPTESIHRGNGGGGFLGKMARKIQNKNSSRNLRVQTNNIHHETGLIIDQH